MVRKGSIPVAKRTVFGAIENRKSRRSAARMMSRPKFRAVLKKFGGAQVRFENS
jgi:hypothetical protein